MSRISMPRPLALVLGAAMVVACPSSETTPETTPPPDAGASEAKADAQTDAQTGCGSSGLRFDDFAWVPADARMLTLVDRHDPGRADALAHLAALASASDSGLPALAAMDYRNLAMQLSVFEMLLTRMGFDPAELALLQGPAGQPAWAWASDCPMPTASAKLLSNWGLMVKAELEHPGIRVGLGDATDPEGFPFDILFIGERRVLVTQAGAGRSTLDWLLRAGPGDPDTPAAVALDALEPAPLRSVLLGEWIGSEANAQTHSGAGSRPVRSVRATATAIELDGSGWVPPSSDP